MIVLDKVPNDPPPLALLLEGEPKRERVERAPPEGMHEEEQDGGRLGQGGQESWNDGVNEDESKGKVASAVWVRFALSALRNLCTLSRQKKRGKTNRKASQLRKMSKSLWKYLLSRSCLVIICSSSTSLARRARAAPVVLVLNMLGVRLGLRCGAAVAAGRDTASRSSASSSVTASSASASVIESS